MRVLHTLLDQDLCCGRADREQVHASLWCGERAELVGYGALLDETTCVVVESDGAESTTRIAGQGNRLTL